MGKDEVFECTLKKKRYWDNKPQKRKAFLSLPITLAIQVVFSATSSSYSNILCWQGEQSFPLPLINYWLSGICEGESSHVKNMLNEQMGDCAKYSRHSQLTVCLRSVSLFFLIQKVITKALPFWLSPFIWKNTLLGVVIGKNHPLNSITMEWLQNSA